MKLLGGPWELEAQPKRGGRIISLRLGGEELLDQGIGVDDPAAAGFVAAGARGWDEMVPNVEPNPYPAPGEWEGIELPDHGEAWRLPWVVLAETAASATLECSGRLLPWRLTRSVELSASTVRFEYSYRNLGRQAVYAYWCAHPLFRYEAGMQMEAGIGWVPPQAGHSNKVFFPRGSVDHARLAWGSGVAVELAWDASVTPYVAIWTCDGDLGGYHHIAIEPATGGNDSPDLSAPPPLLGPGEELSWWLELRDRR